VDRSKIHVIPHGLNLEGHGTRRLGSADGFTIGYFARIAPEKGLHVLVEAFLLLAEDRDLPPLRLRVAGYMSAGDKPYFDAIVERVRSAGLSDRFEFGGELDRAGKIAFLQSLDVMSVPTVYRESKGLSVLEALANAVPLVLPAHGTFPELIADTGGGVLCEPENPRSLADALRKLISDPAAAAEMGRRGQAAIRERYDAQTMARQTTALYRQLTAVPSVSPASV
jgi:glycosyltransferase involved in cell wall biosynthesis